jgi:hypothetical protein
MVSLLRSLEGAGREKNGKAEGHAEAQFKPK